MFRSSVSRKKSLREHGAIYELYFRIRAKTLGFSRLGKKPEPKSTKGVEVAIQTSEMVDGRLFMGAWEGIEVSTRTPTIPWSKSVQTQECSLSDTDRFREKSWWTKMAPTVSAVPQPVHYASTTRPIFRVPPVSSPAVQKEEKLAAPIKKSSQPPTKPRIVMGTMLQKKIRVVKTPDSLRIIAAEELQKKKEKLGKIFSAPVEPRKKRHQIYNATSFFAKKEETARSGKNSVGIRFPA